MNRLIVGIDPGKSGAIVRLEADSGDIYNWEDTSTIDGAYNEGHMVSAIRDFKDKTHVVVIERPVIVPVSIGKEIPKWNSPKSIAAQWEGYALWKGICLGVGVPFVEVSPKKWQREFFGTQKADRLKIGDGKLRSYIYANRRWPDGPWSGVRGGIKIDRSDAALIALYYVIAMK